MVYEHFPINRRHGFLLILNPFSLWFDVTKIINHTDITITLMAENSSVLSMLY